MNPMDRLIPITPGELLDEEFLQPLGVSQYRLAKAIDVPASRISEVVAGRSYEAQVEPRWRSGFYGQMRGISLRPWRRYTLKLLSSVNSSQGSISSLSLINDASARDPGTLF